MPLLALGLNHQTAPLTLRERVALDAGQLPAALDGLGEITGLQGEFTRHYRLEHVGRAGSRRHGQNHGQGKHGNRWGFAADHGVLAGTG